jgi:uncharacterized membrane protein YoaK (UPF0700 family)
MTRYGRHITLLAAGMSALAGFVDATGFLKLGGFFVSFMSGNTTRLAVGLAEGAPSALIAGALIATFVLGVMLGTLCGHAAGRQRAAAILALVCGLLALAAGLGAAQFSVGAVVAMTLAMGAINTVFAQDGEVHISLTYMTGTLVKIGQRLATALLGGARTAWWPYLLLWFGLAAGAVAGALLYPHMGLNSLWLAAFAAGLFAIVAMRANLTLAPATQAEGKR